MSNNLKFTGCLKTVYKVNRLLLKIVNINHQYITAFKFILSNLNFEPSFVGIHQILIENLNINLKIEILANFEF